MIEAENALIGILYVKNKYNNLFGYIKEKNMSKKDLEFDVFLGINLSTPISGFERYIMMKDEKLYEASDDQIKSLIENTFNKE